MFEAIRKITVKSQAVYKYGCPLLLFLFMVLTLCNDSVWYNDNYWWITIVFDCFIFLAIREIYACYIYRKCEWQETSCWGILSFGILNLYITYLGINLQDSITARIYIDFLHYLSVVILGSFTIKTFTLIYKYYVQQS